MNSVPTANHKSGEGLVRSGREPDTEEAFEGAKLPREDKGSPEQELDMLSAHIRLRDRIIGAVDLVAGTLDGKIGRTDASHHFERGFVILRCFDFEFTLICNFVALIVFHDNIGCSNC